VILGRIFCKTVPLTCFPRQVSGSDSIALAKNGGRVWWNANAFEFFLEWRNKERVQDCKREVTLCVDLRKKWQKRGQSERNIFSSAATAVLGLASKRWVGSRFCLTNIYTDAGKYICKRLYSLVSPNSALFVGAPVVIAERSGIRLGWPNALRKTGVPNVSWPVRAILATPASKQLTQ